MKNTNEVQAILTAIFAINRTSEREDKDITLVLDYVFNHHTTLENLDVKAAELLEDLPF